MRLYITISQGNHDPYRDIIPRKTGPYFLKEQFKKARPLLFQTQPTLLWLKKIK